MPNTFSFTTEPETADKRNWEHAVHAIKSLGNAGSPRSIPALMAALKEKKLLTVGRSSAVHALKRIAKRSPNQVLVELIAVLCFDFLLGSSTVSTHRLRRRRGRRSSHCSLFRFRQFDRRRERDRRTACARHQPTEARLQRAQDERQEPHVPNADPDANDVRSLSSLQVTRQDNSNTCRSSSIFLSFAHRKEFISVAMKVSGAFVSCAVTQFPCFSSSYLRGYYSFADLPLPHSLPRDIMGAGFRLSYYTPSGRTIPNNVYAKITGHAFGYYTDILEVETRVGFYYLIEAGFSRLACVELG